MLCDVVYAFYSTIVVTTSFLLENPKEQKAIIIIIPMAPLYAIVSFVGLLDICGRTFFSPASSLEP